MNPSTLISIAEQNDVAESVADAVAQLLDPEAEVLIDSAQIERDEIRKAIVTFKFGQQIHAIDTGIDTMLALELPIKALTDKRNALLEQADETVDTIVNMIPFLRDNGFILSPIAYGVSLDDVVSVKAETARKRSVSPIHMASKLQTYMRNGARLTYNGSEGGKESWTLAFNGSVKRVTDPATAFYTVNGKNPGTADPTTKRIPQSSRMAEAYAYWGVPTRE